MAARYLDHHSGTPLHPRAQQALREAQELFGDPLRLHEAGRNARRALEEARDRIADVLSVVPDEIVFTSGGTESVSLAVKGPLASAELGGSRVVVGAVEHPSVMGSARRPSREGVEVSEVPVDPTGRLDVDRFVAEIRRPGTVLASVQHANHEVGTMQPVAEAASLAREAGVLFHTDACQTVGRLPVEPQALGVDLLSLSGHKFGGPPAIGALYVRRGVPIEGHPPGDERERRRRAGFENVAGAVAMAAALEAAAAEMADQAARQWALTGTLRTMLEERVPGAEVHGHPTQRVPHLVCFSVPGVDPEILLMGLDQRGIRVDAGSVTSGSPHEPSPVLAAMGKPDTVGFRVGTWRTTTDEDIDGLVAALADLVSELSRIR